MCKNTLQCSTNGRDRPAFTFSAASILNVIPRGTGSARFGLYNPISLAHEESVRSVRVANINRGRARKLQSHLANALLLGHANDGSVIFVDRTNPLVTGADGNDRGHGRTRSDAS